MVAFLDKNGTFFSPSKIKYTFKKNTKLLLLHDNNKIKMKSHVGFIYIYIYI